MVKKTDARTESYLPFTVRYWSHGWRFPSCGCCLWSMPLGHCVRSQCILWSFGSTVYFLLLRILLRFRTSMCKLQQLCSIEYDWIVIVNGEELTIGKVILYPWPGIHLQYWTW